MISVKEASIVKTVVIYLKKALCYLGHHSPVLEGRTSHIFTECKVCGVLIRSKRP